MGKVGLLFDLHFDEIFDSLQPLQLPWSRAILQEAFTILQGDAGLFTGMYE